MITCLYIRKTGDEYDNKKIGVLLLFALLISFGGKGTARNLHAN